MTVARTGPTDERLMLANEVAALRAHGLTHAESAAELGISRSYASELATDPDGSQARERKDGYAGVCRKCGGPTSGSNGPSQAPELCQWCVPGEFKVWTREAVIDAIQHWAAQHGRPPVATDWMGADRDHKYPAATTVYAHPQAAFPSWADAIEAAGFPRPYRGHKFNTGREARGLPARAGLRSFVVLERRDDGAWTEHDPVEALNDELAVELLADLIGREDGVYLAILDRLFSPFEIKPVTSVKAVKVSRNGGGPEA